MFRALIYYMNMGGMMLFLIFLVCFYCYLAWRISIKIIEKQNIRPLVRSVIILSCTFLFLLVVAGIGLDIVDYQPDRHANIAKNNMIVRNIEKNMFRGLPSIWMQQETNVFKPIFDASTPVLIFFYESLSPIIGITSIVFLLIRGQLAFQMIVTIFLCQYISLPLWYAFPVESPVLEIFAFAFGNVIPSDLANIIDGYDPNDALMSVFQDRIALDLNLRSFGIFNITAIPSMHAAFAVVLAVYWIRLSKITIAIVVPYIALTFISAIFILQHYAIDMFAGAGIAIIAVMITRHFTFHILDPIILLVEEDKKWLYGRLQSWHNVRHIPLPSWK